MRDRRKRIALALFSLAILSMLLIAISLPGLELNAGTPLTIEDSQGRGLVPLLPRGTASSTSLARSLVAGIIGLLLVGYVIYVVVNFVRHLEVRHILRNMVILILLIVLVIFLPMAAITQTGSDLAGTFTPTPISTGAYLNYPLGQPPLYFLWITLGLLTLGTLAFLSWFLLRRRQAALSHDRILQEAQSAVNALKEGEAFESVILRCYLQMTHILKEEQGLERGAALTAREFVDFLQERGISPSPVRQLTLLFEAARYSTLKPDKREEQVGLDCLNEIIRDCQRNPK
jgi:hypothetical protein